MNVNKIAEAVANCNHDEAHNILLALEEKDYFAFGWLIDGVIKAQLIADEEDGA